MLKMLQLDPRKRPSPMQLVEDDWFWVGLFVKILRLLLLSMIRFYIYFEYLHSCLPIALVRLVFFITLSFVSISLFVSIGIVILAFMNIVASETQGP